MWITNAQVMTFWTSAVRARGGEHGVPRAAAIDARRRRVAARQRHVVYPDGTPLSNLHITLLDKVGVPIDKLGDSTGKFSELLG